MPQQLHFQGRYVLVNEAKVRERANRKDDLRHVFYEAMLENDAYEAYEAAVSIRTVSVETWNPPRLISGHDEIRYVRNVRRPRGPACANVCARLTCC
jgi:hypothetical protein